jgi:hypothetical protein
MNPAITEDGCFADSDDRRFAIDGDKRTKINSTNIILVLFTIGRRSKSFSTTALKKTLGV